MKLLKNITGTLALILFLTVACKKDKMSPGPSKNGTRAELTKDSIFLYAKEIYYWNTALPDYNEFNPRSFNSYNEELSALTQSAVNSSTGKPYEYYADDPSEPKYSFIDDGSLSSELGGIAGDYGFMLKYNDANDLRISYVYQGSSAAATGLKRGYQVLSVNGRTDLDGRDQDNIDFLNQALFGSESPVSMNIKKPDGSTENVTVNRGTYNLNPILYTHVYTVGSKKVGYIVFNAFTGNDAVTSDLTQVCSDFAAAGVSELIVDLRYNGGGSVQTATYFADLIAPASENGNVMHVTYYNQTLQNLKTRQQRAASILVNQPLLDRGKLQYHSGAANGKYITFADWDFSPEIDVNNKEFDNVETFEKIGNLNVNTVYFIVSGSTASASELLINSLKPVMNVKLIGNRTYGKPVGFFAVHIDELDLYIPEFETRNQDGFADYYDGMEVNKSDYDDLTKDFGDPTERYLAYALYYAENEKFPSVSNFPAVLSVKPKISKERIQDINSRLEKGTFKGMVDTRHHR